LKRRLKVVVLAVAVSVIVIVVFISQIWESPSPDFLVYDVEGKVQGQWPSRLVFLYFTIENNGTANATNVVGTAKFEKSGRWTSVDWNLGKAGNVIEVGEKVSGCYAFFSGYSTVPSENFVITVSCDEGVWREFNVTIL